MTRYTADGVAMARYLVDRLPPTAAKVFERAEQGLDVIEAPTVIVSEAIFLQGENPAVHGGEDVTWTAISKEKIAGVKVDTTPNAVLRGLVTEGPVRVAPADEQHLAVYGSLIDHFTLHDGLLIANHRVRGTEALITSDAEFAGENTVWS